MRDDGGARAARWLAGWDAQGIHRTATAGDEAGADWLIREVAALGVAVPAGEEFALDRLDPIAAYLEVDGVRIAGEPVFDAPATGADGIDGALGPVGGEAPIAVAELSPRIVYTPDYQRLRQDARHRGLVIICKGEQPGLGLLNAEQFTRPCAGSRRSARSSPLRRFANTVFTANSGHELGHLGLDDFSARRPGWERPGGATWVHYGANIGAVGGKLSVLSASEDLAARTAQELTRDGCAPDRIAPPSLVPSGETRDIHRAGGRYVTLVGSNPLFHLPQDRWPHAVDAAMVARIAAAAARLVVSLTR